MMLIYAKEGFISLYTLVSCLFVSLCVILTLNQTTIQLAIKDEYITNYKLNQEIKQLYSKRTNECNYFIGVEELVELELNHIITKEEYKALNDIYLTEEDNNTYCVEELSDDTSKIIIISNEYNTYLYLLKL